MTTSQQFLNYLQGTSKFNNPWYFPLDRENNCNLTTQVLELLTDITLTLLTLPKLKNSIYAKLISKSEVYSTSSPALGGRSTSIFGRETAPLAPLILNGPGKSCHISTMLDNMEKNPTLTVHQIPQVKLAKSGTLSPLFAFPLAVTHAMAHIH